LNKNEKKKFIDTLEELADDGEIILLQQVMIEMGLTQEEFFDACIDPEIKRAVQFADLKIQTKLALSTLRSKEHLDLAKAMGKMFTPLSFPETDSTEYTLKDSEK